MDFSTLPLAYFTVRRKLSGFPGRISLKGTLGRSFEIKSLSHSATDGYDLLHLNQLRGVEGSLLYKEKPKIFTSHGVGENITSEYLENIFSNSNFVVAPSNYTAKRIESKCGKKPEVIHHGVNLSLFQPSNSKAKIRRELGVPRNKKVILWNGRITPQKDLRTLLKSIPLVADEIPDALFLIKGRTTDQDYMKTLEPEWVEINRDYGENLMMITNWIRHEDLPKLYGAADLLVHTSIHESFGLTFTEAIACGVPVLASKCATAPEILGDAGSFYPPKDHEKLAEEIISMLKDNKNREKLARKGIERARKKFSWKNAARKYFRLYQKSVF
ncbi:hypothetical protein AKJ52_00645 [candidate division MSBL1 archaeon SCGC-AAA382C18]|uniref:Glycosyl transferase family 1 domain-containing protein n=1 Tax=candidate division MSBL1 archaeon SCGC-AAA382C18 TaxID=1698281 RepID=A0A133VL89_9EURY|nr:hypothetical protein AKJ52_00645 [candidate division MSBL1 archaeon SCGC-AAA382C18]